MSTIPVDRPDLGVLCIDVANVVLDDVLPPVGLGRLDLVIDAWRAEICRYVEVHCFVDASFVEHEARTGVERARLRSMERVGLLQVVREADGPVIDCAERENGCVLSRDAFRDKRRRGAWTPGRYFSWDVRDGLVRIVARRSANTQPYDISRAIEDKWLQRRKITRSRLVVLRRWACVSEEPCITRATTPDALLVLPIERDGVPCCPGCERPLQDRGERGHDVELKLLVDDAVRLRFTLRDGKPLEFGRLALPDTAELAELARDGALRSLGRRHLVLRSDRGRVKVCPVDGRHAVRRRAWDDAKRRFARARPLDPTRFTAIGPRDQLMIGDRIALMRSGRSIAEAQELADAASDAGWQVAQTGPAAPPDGGQAQAIRLARDPGEVHHLPTRRTPADDSR